MSLTMSTYSMITTLSQEHRDQDGDQTRVVVVDDNQDAANVLALTLKLLGNDVRTAYDGFAAIELAESFRPHAMLLDIGMPRMDGYETARRLRRLPSNPSIILLALTGWGQEEDRRNAHEAGFDHHLVKPVDPMSLHQLLRDMLPHHVGR